MNKLLIALVIIAVLGVGGYFLIQGERGQPQIPAGVPTNPPGVVNEEITSTNYKNYTKEEYDQALAERKVVMLYFTANWCPICREQEPLNMKALDELKDENVIALRLHILDSEITQETEALAEKYEVSYQHTTVIIGPSGEVVSKYTGPLTTEDLKTRLIEAKKS